MYDQSLTQVLRLTAEMENRAADGDWGAVQELDAARLAELEKLNHSPSIGAVQRTETLSCLLQSNHNIVNLAREAKSNLSLEREQLVLGRKATDSYQLVQEGL
tara:strand:+ start:216 stop:524 length:309 start_codon:yes stop_codon:yes gene_type:complete